MLSQLQQIKDRRRKFNEAIRALTYAPLMRGSIVDVQRRCGRSNCACAKDPNARHRSKYLSVNIDGRTKTIHLRPEDVDQVQQAIDAYNQLWEAVNGLTACEIADLKRRARERQRSLRQVKE